MAPLLIILTVIAIAVLRITHQWFVPFDSKDEYYPLLRIAIEQILAGQNPFWNAAHFSGYAVAGDPQSLIFSPVTVLGMLLFVTSMAVYDTLVYVYLLIAALALYAFAKAHRTPTSIAFLLAILGLFSGIISARLQHTPIILGYAYFVVFFVLFTQNLYNRWGWISFLPLAAMLLHLSQTAFILSLFFVVWFIGLAIEAWQRSQFKRLLFNGCTCVTLTLLMVTIPLTHVFLVRGEAITNHIPYSFIADNLARGWRSLVTLIVPNFNHNLTGFYQSAGDKTESYLYLSMLPLVLLGLPLVNDVYHYYR